MHSRACLSPSNPPVPLCQTPLTSFFFLLPDNKGAYRETEEEYEGKGKIMPSTCRPQENAFLFVFYREPPLNTLDLLAVKLTGFVIGSANYQPETSDR